MAHRILIVIVLILTASLAARTRADDEPRQISGVYPHLTTYGIYSQDGAHLKGGHDECGIGAIVPWAGRLWMINYAPHMPRGSEHKLFSIDEQLRLTVHPESVGGTPAGRMIHRESNQLLLGPYVIDAAGKVRVIPPQVMPGRLTAIARHRTDPSNKVYYYDMEGALYEANVRTLDVTKLFDKPVPGWHGKGAYTAQGRLVVANNGETSAGSYVPLLVGGPAKSEEEAGVLAEWDGREWRIVERKQYTDVTGPGGIDGAPDDKSPLWAIGWDHRSLRLKVLDGGEWHTYLLPKAAHNNDARHGWYTEWPRIRAIGGGRWMMDMHGMFFDFPQAFSASNTSGLRPIASHLRYIPDFCDWNGRLVLATDETSIQGNKLAGQPQSNLWIGAVEALKKWGPKSAYGGPWVADAVKADTPSDPFLINGFDRCVLHLAVGAPRGVARIVSGLPLRATDQQPITRMPPELAKLPRVTIKRGDWHKPAPGYAFTVNKPVTVYLAVDKRGDANPGKEWTRTDLTLEWGEGHDDVVFKRSFAAGNIEIPGNSTEHTPGSFGMPHTAFVASNDADVTIKAGPGATVTLPRTERIAPPPPALASGDVVRFTIEVDDSGKGEWRTYQTIDVPDQGYIWHVFSSDAAAVGHFRGQWVRLRADKDCIATAYFHLTDARDDDPPRDETLFAGLADVRDATALDARVYAAKRNRNLRVITGDGRNFDFDKETFRFRADEPDAKLDELLKVAPVYTVDDASVIVMQGRQRLRLPKGDTAFDAIASTLRADREVESERHLANMHGTFYEVPLLSNGDPPMYTLMRPVASHRKRIADYCSWNGLLVLTGVRSDATHDGHVFTDAAPGHRTALWFGGVDDLWQLGKPVGVGGPWKRAAVVAGQPSDPYLMTGYDRKRVALTADRDVNITLEVDVDHQTGWHVYKVFAVKSGETVEHTFPAGYSAHWIRAVADRQCMATVSLTYE